MFTGAKYARNGDVSIAYQVVGDGPLDLALTFGWVNLTLPQGRYYLNQRESARSLL